MESKSPKLKSLQTVELNERIVVTAVSEAVKRQGNTVIRCVIACIPK